MEVLRRTSELQSWVRQQKHEAKRIVLVPTMGFLHEGHLSLVDEAKKRGEKVAMSIFVNPTQFGPGEDLEKYPRDLARDQELAEGRGVDVLFIPEAIEIYPEGDQTTVVVTQLTRGLCGPFRPGHFRGVATVVTKLFNLFQPDVAIFGEKDYQQLIMVRQLAEDLRYPIEIVGVPTLRETNGLAMSSRNAYLSQSEREEASLIYQALQAVLKAFQGGQNKVPKLVEAARAILKNGENIELEYLEVVDGETLSPLETPSSGARVLMAVQLGGKRLIDNLELKK